MIRGTLVAMAGKGGQGDGSAQLIAGIFVLFCVPTLLYASLASSRQSGALEDLQVQVTPGNPTDQPGEQATSTMSGHGCDAQLQSFPGDLGLFESSGDRLTGFLLNDVNLTLIEPIPADVLEAAPIAVKDARPEDIVIERAVVVDMRRTSEGWCATDGSVDATLIGPGGTRSSSGAWRRLLRTFAGLDATDDTDPDAEPTDSLALRDSTVNIETDDAVEGFADALAASEFAEATQALAALDLTREQTNLFERLIDALRWQGTPTEPKNP